jgi:hypothetical protein
MKVHERSSGSQFSRIARRKAIAKNSDAADATIAGNVIRAAPENKGNPYPF